MIAFCALLLISQAAPAPIAEVPAVETSSAAKIERMKKLTIEAIAEVAHLRVSLDLCEADAVALKDKLTRARMENVRLMRDLIAAPPPVAFVESEPPWWTLPAIVVVGASAAVLAAGTCAALHCTL